MNPGIAAPGPQSLLYHLGELSTLERSAVPPFLEARGSVAFLSAHPRIAVIGSREASPLGLRRASRLAKELTEEGAAIVSGLARGVDTAALRAAIAGRGKAIAVVGTPLDAPAYPKENAELQATIGREHLLVSQFPEGTPVKPENFRARNRTIALIAQAAIVVEASGMSGTLTAAREVLRLGRPLFLLPSSAEDPSLRWPKELLGLGARVLTRSREAYEAVEGSQGHAQPRA